jgi:rare lipoprotein A
VVAEGRSEMGVGTCAFDARRTLRASRVAIPVVQIALFALLSALFAGCATTQPTAVRPPAPSAQVSSVTGVASWYGPGFLGHRTSSGAVYDQEDLTAASTLFPLATHLLVTNLANGRAVEVTVNDHGPYVKGRQIDLSRKAARVLGVIGPGTANVRMDMLTTPAGGPAIGERFFVQVGSFADSGNARLMQQRLAAAYPDVHIETAEAGANRYYRVRMGAFMNRQDAEGRAGRVASLGYPAVIITE